MAEDTKFKEQETLNETVERLLHHLDAGETSDAADALKDHAPADAAKAIEALPEKERIILWQELDVERQVETIPNLSASVKDALVRSMSLKSLVATTKSLPTDEAVDVLQSLPKKSAAAILEKLGPGADRQLTSIISLPANQAGGLMNTDVTCIRANIKLGTVTKMLQELGGLPANTDELIVVGKDKKYIGSLPVATLLTGKPDSIVKNCMRGASTAIAVDWPLEKITSAFVDKDLFSAPVVDADGSVIGRITVDDITYMLKQQIGDTMLKMRGLGNDDDLFSPVLKSAWHRSIWLCANLITAFLASWVIGRFEESLNELVALAILMPVVASMGGVAGSQTLTVTVRGLALGQLGPANTGLLVQKELGVALLNGIIWMASAAYIAFAWFDDLSMSLIFGFSILINLLAAALAGVAIPLIMQRMHIDPAIAGSVVLTTVTDVIGFVTFLGLGTFILLSV
ncbi:MAG: magnesium transporter [Candidatus Porifericomitaceae bacterium WSBS_2022_MAG_OTU9]